MRLRNLLGLAAVGGAVAYAQKKRGGELSLAGFKQSAQDLLRSLGLDQRLGSITGEPFARPIPDEELTYSSSRGGTTTRTGYGEPGYPGDRDRNR